VSLRVFLNQRLGSLPLRAPACWAFPISNHLPPLRKICTPRTIFSSQSPRNLSAPESLLFAAYSLSPIGRWHILKTSHQGDSRSERCRRRWKGGCPIPISARVVPSCFRVLSPGNLGSLWLASSPLALSTFGPQGFRSLEAIRTFPYEPILSGTSAPPRRLHLPQAASVLGIRRMNPSPLSKSASLPLSGPTAFEERDTLPTSTRGSPQVSRRHA
jgi:hypothetical protein